MQKSELVRNASVTLLSFLIMGFFAVATISIKSLNPITETIANFSFTDIYYNIIHQTSEPQESNCITIVDINQFEGRGNFADLLEELEALDPKVICIDAVFEGPHLDDAEGDMRLADVAEKYSNIIYSVKLEDMYAENDTWVSLNQTHSYFTEFTDVKEAFCNMPRGNLYDSMKREIPIRALMDTTECRSIIVETASMFAERDVSNGNNGLVKINYSPMHFPKLKPADVSKHRELIDGRIVFLGDMHDGYDMHWTPTGEKLAGVEILAYGTQTMLDRKEIVEFPFSVTFMLSYIVVFIMFYIKKWHIQTTQASSNIFVKYMLGSSYAQSVLFFGITSMLLYVSFFIFSMWCISLGWGWALTGFAFLSTADNLYTAMQNYLMEKMKQVTELKHKQSQNESKE